MNKETAYELSNKNFILEQPNTNITEDPNNDPVC